MESALELSIDIPAVGGEQSNGDSKEHVGTRLHQCGVVGPDDAGARKSWRRRHEKGEVEGRYVCVSGGYRATG